MQKKNNDLKKHLTLYFRDIKRLLLCRRKLKVKILNDLKNNIDDYIESNPNVTIDMIIDHFGTPRTIVEGFAAQAGIDYIKKAKLNKRLKIVFIIVLSAILIFIGILTAIIAINNSRNAGYYYEESVSDYGITEIIK